MNKGPENIDEYIAVFPEEVRKKLSLIRKTILKSAPEAEELMSYRMPAYRMGEILVYFAGYKNHIGFYPTSSAIDAFRSELSEYTFGRGSIRFPLDKPVPYNLIAEIVRFRVAETAMKKSLKRDKKK